MACMERIASSGSRVRDGTWKFFKK